MKRLPKIGVSVVIIKDGKVLLGRRKTSHGSGTWQFPGGHLEFNEKVEDCAKREILEETGLKIKDVRYRTLTEDFYPELNKHYVTLFVTANYDSGEPTEREPEKSGDWNWFEWVKLPTPLFLPIENLLKQNFNPFS